MGPIDVHAHYIPPGFLEAVQREPARYGVDLERASDGRLRFFFPDQGLRWFPYDTITHLPTALRYLVDLVGVERIVLGSDAPFDIRDPAPVESIRKAGLGEASARAILDTNPARLFALAPRQ
jgi:aminocarboxymuconate-semialdehyde decarboxylase